MSIVKVKLGAEQRVTVRVSPGTYKDEEYGVIVDTPAYVDQVQVFGVRNGTLAWHADRIDWNTVRPVDPPVVTVANGIPWTKRLLNWIKGCPAPLPEARMLPSKE